MHIDNNNYFIKTTGMAAGTLWSTLWAIATNIGDVIDLTSVTNRSIAESGYLVISTGTAFAQASGTSVWSLVCATAATLATPTVLWSVTPTFSQLVAFGANAIAWVVKIPPNIPLQFLGVSWAPVAAAFTAGTANIFITSQAPYPAL